MMAQSSFPPFGLIWYLGELTKEEFKRFKELLREEPLKFQLTPIPWVEIKKASKEHLAGLLDQRYPRGQAWEVTMSLFLQINRVDLWEKIREEVEYRRNPYRKYMKEKFRSIWDRELPVPDGFYRDTCQHEFMATHNACTIDTGPATVVLRGPEGTGKTTLLLKVMLEWAEGKFWKDRFTFVFFFNVYELNSNMETNLVELISRDWPASSEIINDIFSQPEKILFIMDGFEELKLDLESQTNLCDDWRQRQPAQVILSSLLRKKMLPEASLLLALGKISQQKIYGLLHNPKDIYFYGFSQDTLKSYVYCFFRDRNKAKRAFTFLKGIEPLLSLCSSPLTCWMVCSSLKRQLDIGEEPEIICENCAGLYVSFLATAFKGRNENCLTKRDRARFTSLCVLAAEGVWTQTFMFCQEDLGKRGISQSDVSVWLSMKLLQRKEFYFIFHHMSMQAFCAAMYYLLKQPTDGPNPAIGSVTQLITASMTQAQTHLSQMRLFLFAISNERIMHILETSLGFLVSRECKQEMSQCLRDISEREASEKVVNFQELFEALFETHDENFIRGVTSCFEEISLNIDDTDPLTIASFCLQHCENLKKIHLRVQKIFSGDATTTADYNQAIHFWQEFCSAFAASPNLQVLELDNCCLNDDSMMIFMKAVAQPACKLQSLLCNFMSNFACGPYFFKTIINNTNLKCLNMYGTSLSTIGVKFMCEALRHPLSNIEKLVLGKCDITAEDCVEIAAVLVHSNRLQHLSLAENPIMDDGVEVLCDALKHPKCVLKILVLSYCCLSSTSGNCFAEALLHNRSLCLLDLGSNFLVDDGVAALCAALSNPCCTLQELWLVGCYLTPACCMTICSVLIRNKNLKSLRLGKNEIRDEGVKVLSDALKHPNCKLQSLGLEGCQLTSACCPDLASVLTSCKTLWNLNINWITLDIEGLALLRDALIHRDCGLKVLGLDKQTFTPEFRLLLESLEAEIPQLTISHHPWIEEEYRIKGAPQRGNP